MAAVIAFLASDEAIAINGGAVQADGGWLSH
jgi:NAD(P)-dependent dehydrogenase (short-subunit alcohol dehydrogenase family)